MKQYFKKRKQTIHVHKYTVYNKTHRHTYSVYDDSLNRTALMNHSQIKEL